MARALVPDDSNASSGDGIDAYLDSLGDADLRDLVTDLAASSQQVREALRRRAMLARDEGAKLAGQLTREVRAVLRGSGFIGSYEASEYASQVDSMLDGIEGVASAPDGGDTVRQPLRRLVTGLGEVLENAEDMEGEIAEVRQRAADLYIDACARSLLGDDQRRELGEWIVGFRLGDDYGVNGMELEKVLPVLGAAGVEGFRNGVAERTGAGGSYELDLMRLELADHDGDVDAAMRILTEKDSPGYGGIVSRLVDAGRADEAYDWARRAFEAGNVTSVACSAGGEFWLDADLAVDLLAEHGGVDEAASAWRGHFLAEVDHRPSIYEWLLSVAGRYSLRDREREWALDAVAERARKGGGDTLIRIRLADGDAEGAWRAVDEFGVGEVWRELVREGAGARPRDAAQLYRREAARQLRQVSGRNTYALCADYLKEMHRLYTLVGEASEAARVVQDLMAAYGRRPAMLDEFRKAGLG